MVLLREQVNALHVLLLRHRAVHTDDDRHHASVLRQLGYLELHPAAIDRSIAKRFAQRDDKFLGRRRRWPDDQQARAGQKRAKRSPARLQN